MFPYTTRGKKYARKSEATVDIPQVWYDLSSMVVHKEAGFRTLYLLLSTGRERQSPISCTSGPGNQITDIRQWFLFDDSKVTLAKEAEVLDADAYLLFYLVRSLDGPIEQKSAAAGSSA
jgi:hypothetical protein